MHLPDWGIEPEGRDLEFVCFAEVRAVGVSV